MALTTALEKGAVVVMPLIMKERLRVGRNIQQNTKTSQTPFSSPLCRSPTLMLSLQPSCRCALTPARQRTDLHQIKILSPPRNDAIATISILSDPRIRFSQKVICLPNSAMDPRHQLYKSLDKLAVDPNSRQQNMSAGASQSQAASGVTIEGLKRKLVEQLGAVYVEIEDMSGR